LGSGAKVLIAVKALNFGIKDLIPNIKQKRSLSTLTIKSSRMRKFAIGGGVVKELKFMKNANKGDK
jgi:hypothetical protein